jgi:hypothetical protein
MGLKNETVRLLAESHAAVYEMKLLKNGLNFDYIVNIHTYFSCTLIKLTIRREAIYA